MTLPGHALRAQEFWGAGHTFTCVRKVVLPPRSGNPHVIVTEFFTYGELRPDGSNLAVYDHLDQLVPWRLLQVGPGDFCRVAFQRTPPKTVYKVYYGGKPPPERPRRWTAPTGLLLETCRWKRCDLNSLGSVREAVGSSEVVGRDYVPTVFHRHNPFWPDPEPFLSLYRGVLQVETAGRYQFYTSSQDCSFLLIDGKPVVAAPGYHGPVGDARIRGEVHLSAGPHPFDYVHAAAGPDACMVAAWQPPNARQPEVIPPSAFGAGEVAHVLPAAPRHVTRGALREFALEVLGEAPVADSDQPVVRVQFHEDPSRAPGPRARCRWDFGDGQVTEAADPTHLYLHPGLYTVRMSLPGGSPLQETVNRVQVHRCAAPADPKRGPDRLADYRPMLNHYSPARLDAAGALQLVRVCEQLGQIDRAAAAGKARLLAERPLEDEAVAYALVQIVGPLLRDRLDDPASAAAAWEGAARGIRRVTWKAACEVEAADIRLNDLHQRAEARALLDAATARLAGAGRSSLLSRLHRLWGDWHARGGDRQAARTAYARAAGSRNLSRGIAEQNARRGAFSRSTEAFLREKAVDRALDELRRWQDEFPADKADGDWPLLWARYCVARGKLPHATVATADLLAVNPDSPYADQLVFLAAACEEKLGHADRALAGYRSLVTDYPGSPLVPTARQKLAPRPADAGVGPKKAPTK
jgi:TolA-binding protein